MIKPVNGTNGKPPAQFPATRGEFEHLTSKSLKQKKLVTLILIATLRALPTSFSSFSPVHSIFFPVGL